MGFAGAVWLLLSFGIPTSELASQRGLLGEQWLRSGDEEQLEKELVVEL